MVNQLVDVGPKMFYDYIAAYSQHLTHTHEKLDRNISGSKYKSSDGVCRAEVTIRYKKRRFYINKGWSPHAQDIAG